MVGVAVRIRRPGDEPHVADKAIFLAGPTPRSADVPSWRPGFIDMFYVKAPEQVLYVPEGNLWLTDYDGQVAWAWDALCRSKVVLFWIPRNVETMPGFTTNVEFGLMLGKHEIVLGWPPEAKKMGYLKWHADRLGLHVYSTPEALVEAAMLKLQQI